MFAFIFRGGVGFHRLIFNIKFILDCGDKSDELNCLGIECTHDEFQCNDGKCILTQWVCDKESDCPDGSDERVSI